MTTQKKTRPAGGTKRTTAAAKSAPARPRRRPVSAVTAATPDPRHVAERAYFLSLAGSADPVSNWLQAERELAAAA